MPPLPLAHRGLWWPDRHRQNDASAFWLAAKAGHGLELDVRLWGGKDLVIQHGPRDPTLPLSADLAWLFTAPLLAWNLKDLFALRPLAVFLKAAGLLEKSVLFDFELLGPGARTLADKELGVSLLSRASDREGERLEAALQAPAAGIWLDAFEQDWVTEETIHTVHAAGKSAYVVSPELHGRPLDLATWKAWGEADGICTDFPHLLAQFDAGGGPLEPVDPWWGP